MNESLTIEQSIEAFIDDVMQQCSSNIDELPQNIIDEISIRAAWVIDFIRHLKGYKDDIKEIRTQILFRLIDEGLSQIRYSVDRKDKKGYELLKKVQESIDLVMNDLTQNLKVALNQVIFDSKLAIEIILKETAYSDKAQATQIDINHRLPELLERLRREKVFKNAFELYELLLPHIQLMPVMTQLSLIAEMAHSKKATAHEVAMLMLLHPKSVIRKKVADILYQLSAHQVFTPVDLRRLIMIRNWVPLDERVDIDTLISYLRKNNLAPAPYPIAKITRLVGSSMDGAGAAYIIMESKKIISAKLLDLL